ncbi:hypothetical protein [Allorhizobium undicola]|uniref:hypothetical protein n=1 Tax=Allorhizobium undicola TaxID=78527 RepID=UPI000487B54D|nr:hypothetical protein [Allorhizobium undicola]
MNVIAQVGKLSVDEAILSMMDRLSSVQDMPQVLPVLMDFLSGLPANRRLQAAASLAHANPFFLPAMGEDSVRQLSVSLDQFAELVFRAKLTAHHAKQPNVLVACAPKSASTFISAALCQAMQVPTASLALPALTPLASSNLGGNLRSQETDELALLRVGLNGRGYVGQHHIRCTPFLASQLQVYNIRTIVTIRNFFDTLVSLDDMLVSWRASGGSGFYDDGLPADYASYSLEERLDLLVAEQAVWYAQFLLSWTRCEREGRVKPLWVRYETDFLGDKKVLSARIAEFIGNGYCDADKLLAAFGDTSDADRKRINKGVSGRGAAVPVAVRDRAMRIFERYAADCDMTPLTG